MPSPAHLAAITETLAQLPLFAGLSKPGLAQLAQASQSRQMPKGAVIYYQNDPAEVLYVVRSGSIVRFFSNADGRELITGEIQAGHYFGELGLITGSPRRVTALAYEKCELILIPRAPFLAALEREPVLARNLLQVAAEELYLSAERERALAFMDAPARLARILLQLDQQTDDTGYITISQEELARRTGLTRQTVAKSLGRWRRGGWLLTGRGKIVLLNQAALRQVEQQALA